MRVVFLSLAVSDLMSIRRYIAQDNPDAAQQVAARLKAIIQAWCKNGQFWVTQPSYPR